MIAIIIITLICLFAIDVIYIIYRNRQSVTKQSLTGGSKLITEGKNSYCEIHNDKFVKYYIERKSFDFNIYDIIHKTKITKRLLPEASMLSKLNSIMPNLYPKLYFARTIDLIPEIFDKIRLAKHYDKNNIDFKVMTIKYIESISLNEYLLSNGLVVSGRDIILNNVSLDIMVKVCSFIFKTVMQLINKNVMPYDIENISNILITKDNKFKIIDCALYQNIVDRNKLTNNDLFMNWFIYVYYLQLRDCLHLFRIISKHNNNEQIIHESLKDIIPKRSIDFIINEFIRGSYQLNFTRRQLIRSFMNEECAGIVPTLELFHNCIYNHKLVNEIAKRSKLFKNNNESLFDIKTDNDLRILYHEMKSINELDKLFIVMNYILKQSIKKVFFDLCFVIQNTNDQPIKTLYYDPNYKLIGYDKPPNDISNVKLIKTNKYITLTYDDQNCSVERKYLGLSSNYGFDGRYCINVKQLPTKYLIFDYDVDDCILNWTNMRDDKHFGTSHGLRLMRTNRQLFDEIISDVKNNNPIDKYITNNIMSRACASIKGCYIRGIDFEQQFDSLMNYIKTHERKYQKLYRGETSYNEFNIKVGSIIERVNIHTWSTNKNESLKFATEHYHERKDVNVKCRFILKLKTGMFAKIHPILFNIFDELTIDADWYEYLHQPSKFRVDKVKPKNNNIYELTLNEVK